MEESNNPEKEKSSYRKTRPGSIKKERYC